MKKYIALLILICITSIIKGCDYNNETEITVNELENEVSISDETINNSNLSDKKEKLFNDYTVDEVNENYKKLNKNELSYNVQPGNLFIETKDGFVGSESGLVAVDDKKYGYILQEYTYATEVNSTKMRLEDAMDLIKSVLPDDINELRRKYDESTQHTDIVYNTSQGNFIASVAYDLEQAESIEFDPNNLNDMIIGISYMKEIK